MKALIAVLIISCFSLLCAQGQVQTIAVTSNAVVTNGFYNGSVLTVGANSFATLKSIIGPASLQITSQGATFTMSEAGYNPPIPVVIAGPATIQILENSAYFPASCFATFSVEPAPFPPGKTATVGAYAGNVQVTLQMSTDLVNWAPAVSGQLYTNSPDARFFRIQLVTNGSP